MNVFALLCKQMQVPIYYYESMPTITQTLTYGHTHTHTQNPTLTHPNTDQIHFFLIRAELPLSHSLSLCLCFVSRGIHLRLVAICSLCHDIRWLKITILEDEERRMKRKKKRERKKCCGCFTSTWGKYWMCQTHLACYWYSKQLPCKKKPQKPLNKMKKQIVKQKS